MKLRRSLVAVAALALPAVACQLLVGIDDHDFRTPDGAIPVEAGADAIPLTCTFGAGPPPQPTILDDVDQPPIVFAVRHATLGGRNADGGVVGFDVDGVCTCDARDHSAREGGVSCTPPASPLQPGGCDEDGGIDNAIAYAFDFFSLVPDFATAGRAIDVQINCGRQTMLYTLSGYNGQANDPSVTLVGFEAVGIHEPQDGGIADGSACGVDEAAFEAGATYPAKFDGTDVWSKSTDTQAGVLTGWVRDFQLVLDGRPRVGLSSPVLPFLFGPRVVTIGTPIMVARLVPLDENGKPLAIDGAGKIQSLDGKARSFRLEDGLVGGRASASDVLVATGAIRVAGAQPGQADLCAHLDQYCVVKGIVCSAVDTMKLPNLDFRGVPCDAVTMALQFDAVPASLSPIARPPEPGSDSGCAKNFTDSCDDAAICP